MLGLGRVNRSHGGYGAEQTGERIGTGGGIAGCGKVSLQRRKADQGGQNCEDDTAKAHYFGRSSLSLTCGASARHATLTNWPADGRRYPQIRKTSSRRVGLENLAIRVHPRLSAGQLNTVRRSSRPETRAEPTMLS